ncbi:MAG: phosphatidylglycerophosphatase A [Patescibacteria group bacterium]
MDRQQKSRSWGTIVALFVLVAFRDASFQMIAAIAISSFIVGLIVIGSAKRSSGRAASCYYDEFHGMFVAALPIWFFDLRGNLQFLAIFMAFLLFTVCDEQKPWPINKTEKRFARSAFGIMVNNTVAGGMSAVLLGVFIAAFGRA